MNHRLKFIARLLVGCAAVVGMAVITVSLTPLVRWWGVALAGPWNDPRGDVLVVLGGSTEDDGAMGESSYRRSRYAAMAYRDYGFRVVLLTGGGVPKPIAQTMKEYLVFLGVPASAVHVEAFSTSTRENALHSREVLAHIPGRKVLLTSDYHMARAHRAFKKVGVEVEPLPIPDVLKRVSSMEKRWGAFIDLARESVTLAYYFARGWI